MSTAASPPGEAAALDHLRLDDRRRALRALLRKPLLLAEDPADATEFTRVRRHADDLREWFSRQAGWSLDITADFARLRKTPADLADASRPALDERSNEPFTRRRYVLLCLALAVLIREERQTTLGHVADEVVNLWNQDPSLAATGMTFRMETSEERRDLVQVVRLLLAWQVLRRLDGAEDRFVHDRTADVLYNVRHIVLSRLFAGRRAPSLVAAKTLNEQLAALVEEPLIDTDEQRNRRIRLGLVRRLLDDPVIYYRELHAEEQAYLLRQRWHLVGQLSEATGFVPEERMEGFALTDPFGDCSDVGMPEEGTDGHATILVAEFLAARRSESEGSIVPMPAIADFVAAKAAEHRSRWRREATVAGHEEEFAREIVARLAGLGLVRIVAEGILPMPAIHRFRLRASDEPAIAVT
jgi:uncharacterized protein (TIGR02678 family)